MPGVSHSKQWTVHNRGEGERTGKVELTEMSVRGDL